MVSKHKFLPIPEEAEQQPKPTAPKSPPRDLDQTYSIRQQLSHPLAHLNQRQFEISTGNRMLVRQLMQIQNRRSQHRNFLVESVNGQNHYLIPAHSRSQVQLTLKNTVQSVHVSFASQSLAKSVSQTNLPARKATVLSQHRENLRMIRRLAMTKSHVEGGLQTASAAPVDLNSSFL
jgi:hypothetical protein